MSLSIEILEVLISVLPILLAVIPFVRPPRVIGAWVGYVLLTATMSVLSMGFLLMRLVAVCAPPLEPCPFDKNNPEAVITTPVEAGLLQTAPPCSICVSDATSVTTELAIILNGLQEIFAIGSAIVCTLISLSILVRFAVWVKKQSSL